MRRMWFWYLMIVYIYDYWKWKRNLYENTGIDKENVILIFDDVMIINIWWNAYIYVKWRNDGENAILIFDDDDEYKYLMKMRIYMWKCWCLMSSLLMMIINISWKWEFICKINVLMRRKKFWYFMMTNIDIW